MPLLTCRPYALACACTCTCMNDRGVTPGTANSIFMWPSTQTCQVRTIRGRSCWGVKLCDCAAGYGPDPTCPGSNTMLNDVVLFDTQS